MLSKEVMSELSESHQDNQGKIHQLQEAVQAKRIEKENRLNDLKQAYLDLSEMIAKKQAAAEDVLSWRLKLANCWLQMTELLADDWGYDDIYLFRELWKMKKPSLDKICLRAQVWAAWEQAIAEKENIPLHIVRMKIQSGELKVPNFDFFELAQDPLTRRSRLQDILQNNTKLWDIICNFDFSEITRDILQNRPRFRHTVRNFLARFRNL